jgi:hypothetical protein
MVVSSGRALACSARRPLEAGPGVCMGQALSEAQHKEARLETEKAEAQLRTAGLQVAP